MAINRRRAPGPATFWREPGRPRYFDAPAGWGSDRLRSRERGRQRWRSPARSGRQLSRLHRRSPPRRRGQRRRATRAKRCDLKRGAPLAAPAGRNTERDNRRCRNPDRGGRRAAAGQISHPRRRRSARRATRWRGRRDRPIRGSDDRDRAMASPPSPPTPERERRSNGERIRAASPHGKADENNARITMPCSPAVTECSAFCGMTAELPG
jgi:hypothetical protein